MVEPDLVTLPATRKEGSVAGGWPLLPGLACLVPPQDECGGSRGIGDAGAGLCGNARAEGEEDSAPGDGHVTILEQHS